MVSAVNVLTGARRFRSIQWYRRPLPAEEATRRDVRVLRWLRTKATEETEMTNDV